MLVDGALEEAEVREQHLTEEARVELDSQATEVLPLLLAAVHIDEGHLGALEELELGVCRLDGGREMPNDILAKLVAPDR